MLSLFGVIVTLNRTSFDDCDDVDATDGDGGSDVRDDDVCGDVDATDGDGDRDGRDGDDVCGAVGATGGDGDNDVLDDDGVCGDVNATDGVNGSSTGGNGDSNSDGDVCVSGVGDGGVDDAVLIVS